MLYEVAQSKGMLDGWRVEAIYGEGVYVAIFSGPNAENRARTYAGWMNGKD